MKKIVNGMLIFVPVIAITLAFAGCVNAVMPDLPTAKAGWPTDDPMTVSKQTIKPLSYYGILDMMNTPPEAGNISYEISPDGTLTVVFRGTDTTVSALDDYLNTKWTPDVTATTPTQKGYSRGITNVVFDKTRPPTYGLSFTRDPGTVGWPSDDKLREFQVPDLKFPLALQSAYHIIAPFQDLTPDPDNPGAPPRRSIMLTLMMYANNFVPTSYGRDIEGVVNGESVTEQDLKNYFNNTVPDMVGSWSDADDQHDPDLDTGALLPDNCHAYYRGTTAYLYANNAPYFFEVDVEKDFYHYLGWPGDNNDPTLLGDYGIHRLPKPAGITDSSYEENKDSSTDDSIDPATGDTTQIISQYTILNMGFFGTAADEKTITDYFAGPTWKIDPDVVPPRSGDFYYKRGIASVEFDTSYKPYYEINVSKDTASRTGWPNDETLNKYALYGMTLPTGATRITYIEQDGQLILWFFGTSDTQKELQNDFSVWNPYDPTAIDATTQLPQGPLPDGVYGYDRGPTSLTFDTSTAPFYEIAVSKTATGEQGWPCQYFKDYGLHGLPNDLPAGVRTKNLDGTPSEDLSYILDPVNNTLTMMFFAETNDKMAGIEKYFKDYFNTANNWKPVATDDASGTTYATDYTKPGVFAWQRGISFVTFDTTQAPYYELEASIDVTNCIKAWPSQDAIKNYGLHGLTQPASGIDKFSDGSTQLEYFTETISDISQAPAGTDPATFSPSSSLTIWFYSDGSSTAANAVKTYFATNNWQQDPDIPSTDTVFNYVRGIASVTFDTSEAPYYEIQSTKDTSIPANGGTGWPTNHINEYGLQNVTQPSGIDNVSGTPQIGYTIETVTDISQADPNTDPATFTPSSTLTIWFYGNDSTTAMNAVTTYFTTVGNHWSPSKDDTGNLITDINGKLFYWSRGLADVVFDTSQAPYYEIQVTKDLTGTPSWPNNQGIQEKYGLHQWPWLSSVPSGVDTTSSTLSYLEDSTDANANPRSLTIRFYGTTATESAIRDYFENKTGTYNWAPYDPTAKDETTGLPQGPLPDGVYGYTRGMASVTFDTSQAPYYEIDVDFTCDGTAWPLSTDTAGTTTLNTALGTYQVAGLAGSMPVDTATHITNKAYSVTPDTDPVTGQPLLDSSGQQTSSLTIMFYATQAELNSITAWFTSGNGWAVDTDPLDAIAGNDVYINAVASAAVDKTCAPYYEISVNLAPGACMGWPASAIWTYYGLTVASQPSGVSGPSYIDDRYDGVNNTDGDDLTVWFSGTGNSLSTLENTITGYFGTWIADAANPKANTSGTFAYSKGAFDATFIIGTKTGSGQNQTCSYSLEITKNPNVNTGWPTDKTVWDNAGLSDAFVVQQGSNVWPTSATSPGYGITSDGTLLVWFSGTTSTWSLADSLLTSATNGWVGDATNPKNTNSNGTYVFDYTKGLYSAEMTVAVSSSSAYFEIEFSLNSDFTTIVPSNLSSTYHLGNSGPSSPAISTTYYFVDSTDANTLTIIFSASAGSSGSNVQPVVEAWLASNGWASDAPTASTAEYYYDPLSADLSVSGTAVTLVVYLN